MSKFFELTTNSLLVKIAPQPDDQRRFIILIGYVLADDSSQVENPTVRVYPDLDLCTYLEVQIRDVVWAEKAIPGQESSPTKLVLNAAAKVNRVTTAARHVETEFLGGRIAAGFLPTAAPGAPVNLSSNQDDLTAQPDCHTPVPVPPVRAVAHTGVIQTGVCVADPPVNPF